jgi:Mg-chelatase subunit ChlD
MDQLAGRPGDFGIGNVGGVGAPDWNKVTLLPEGEEAHFDNADYLDQRFTGKPYTLSRYEASLKLMKTIYHLRDRFGEGRDAAKGLLDQDVVILKSEVNIDERECTFAGHIVAVPGARAKCNVFEGLGRSLHGVQDFYSHSNYADRAGPGPISLTNPPGLDRHWNSPLLNMRTRSDFDVFSPRHRSEIPDWEVNNPDYAVVPYDLATGCFNGLDITESFDSLSCVGRIRHKNLDKDHGEVNLRDPFRPLWQTGGFSYSTKYPPTIGSGSPRSDALPGNFNAAATQAVQDTIRQWKDFRDTLRSWHGVEKGNLMICALVRDNPLKDCYGRKIAIVVDSSGSNTWTDPSNLRVKAAKGLNGKLTTKDKVRESGIKPDMVTVIDFDDYARVIYPMGDPAKATFDAIDSAGGTDIGSGISLAIDEILKVDSDPAAHKSGVIVFTDGQDGNPANQIRQLERARTAGIRVSVGFLDPASLVTLKRDIVRRASSPDLLLAILKTGGIYSTIASAEAQENFVTLVSAHGLVDIDSAGSSVGGSAGVSTVLWPGLTVAEMISSDSRRFLYSPKAGEKLNLTVTPISPFLSLQATLHDITGSFNISTTAVNHTAVTFHYEGLAEVELELNIVPMTGNMTEGVFTVGLRRYIPPSNGTNITALTNSTGALYPTGTGASGPSLYPTGTSSALWTNITFPNTPSESSLLHSHQIGSIETVM